MVKAVLFDLDGTLADTAPDLCYAVNCMRRARGLDAVPLEKTRPVTSSGARGLLGAGFGVTPAALAAPNFIAAIARMPEPQPRSSALRGNPFSPAMASSDALMARFLALHPRTIDLSLGRIERLLARLNQEVRKMSGMQDVKDKLALQGAEVMSSTPEEFARRIRDDLMKWGKIVRDSGAKAD